ncbi:hypothetical protein LNTAR_06344 [Lentisphaera araneosa HTCC2155]|uniref:Uncharacterized protein n=1 Tax=Lentisphaera araneosa HTCC2155 TaxID=313628 RepID=A6DN95_9BACT|nr:hypothetical protein [Lentisphaera araneosa]EDM26843.1 hypothetical protein LNTAR_06344 [Lentisphaera araneosa HTCC2155]
MSKTVELNSVEEVLTHEYDDYSMCNDLSYEYKLNFTNSGVIQGLAHDLHHLKSHIGPNGISTYLDHMEELFMVEQALRTLQTINSPNYEVLKGSLTKVEIDEDGWIETENYNDSEDWEKWSDDDHKLLLKWIESNKERFK